MKRYTTPIFWLLLVFAVSAILPTEMDAGSRCKTSHDSAILSQSILPACPAVSDPTCRGRVSGDVMPSVRQCDTIKSIKMTAFQSLSACQRCANRTEITLLALDCMLQI